MLKQIQMDDVNIIKIVFFFFKLKRKNKIKKIKIKKNCLDFFVFLPENIHINKVKH